MMPLDFEKRHIRTMGSNQYIKVFARLLAGLWANCSSKAISLGSFFLAYRLVALLTKSSLMRRCLAA